MVKVDNERLEENHSGTAFLKPVGNAGLATLHGLGLLEPKKWHYYANKVVTRVLPVLD